MQRIFIFVFFALAISAFVLGCARRSTSVIVNTNYDAEKNQTTYAVLPIGSVILPGKWEKGSYNGVSHQQFFANADSVEIAIAFNRFDRYEFNPAGALKGVGFVRAFYEWDSKYLVETRGLLRRVMEEDTTRHFMVYNVFGRENGVNFDTYFLIGEKNGNVSNFSVSITPKWAKSQKIAFLKSLFVQ
jgi:hypothetical protein